MPRVTVEFYKPSVLCDPPRTFESLLDQILGLNPVERIRRTEDPAGIFDFQKQGASFEGQAARIRMQELPTVVDIRTARQHDLDVRDAEGLSEAAHFLYEVDLDVLVVQRTREIRASAVARLVWDLTDASILLKPVLKEDAWRRFQKMPLVKKIKFKLARPANVDQERRPALMRVLHEIQEFDGVSATIEISVGRTKNRWLNRNMIGEILNGFREGEADFKSLSIMGAIREDNEPDHTEIIDFIADRLQYSDDVRLRDRKLDSEGCKLVLRRAIREHRQYLQTFIE